MAYLPFGRMMNKNHQGGFVVFEGLANLALIVLSAAVGVFIVRKFDLKWYFAFAPPVLVILGIVAYGVIDSIRGK